MLVFKIFHGQNRTLASAYGSYQLASQRKKPRIREFWVNDFPSIFE